MMKKFILLVCGSFVGSFLAFLIFTLCALAMSFSIFFSMSKTSMPSLKDNSVLYIDLAGNMPERDGLGSPSVMEMLQGYEEAPSLSTIVKAIHVAKSESKIKGIVLNCDGAGASVATLRQLREALAEFKKDSKKMDICLCQRGLCPRRLLCGKCGR